MKLPKLFYFITCLWLLCSACNQDKTAKPSLNKADRIVKIDSAPPSPYEGVSLISLIANPEKYHNRHVRVIGYLNLQFEGNGLYFHKEDYDKFISKNGLWVSISRDSTLLTNVKQCNNNYVLIEATFDSNNTGHMGMWSGALTDIKRIEKWGDFITPTER
jgi:predicted RNA-binding protein YlqC (UPF0109 family)